MVISAAKVRVFAEMASLAGARPAQPPPQGADAFRDSRYLAALSALGIESAALRALVRVAPTASAVRFADDPTGRYAHVAIFFDRLLEAIKRENPDMPEANARHIAQTETIIANSGIFPPSALFLYPEIGEAGTTPVAGAADRGGAGQPSIAACAELYREWD